MTDVIRKWHGFGGLALCVLFAAAASPGFSEPPPSGSSAPDSANSLFAQLGSVGLDPARVYRARDVSIDRSSFHITLDDGTIAFTEDVAGHVTGAFFEGDGEILLTPPNRVERGSMSLFTGGAILEERFTSAYFRFNDDTFDELQSSLGRADNVQDFVARWDATARNLARADALRLLLTFSQFLSTAAHAADHVAAPPKIAVNDDRFLHARLQGITKGPFDIYFDLNAPEQVWAGQFTAVEGGSYYDVWTSFSLLKKSKDAGAADSIAAEEGSSSAVDITDCKVRASIRPPTSIDADAVLQLRVGKGGQRTLLFELARTLVIRAVEADGHPVEFIHNPTLDGTQLARRGNDLVAVIFPQPIQTGQRIQLRFVYGGEVLSEAGAGLLYVGARGTWYPNRGLALSNFDLEFHYPADWTLVATGKNVDTLTTPNSPPPSGEHVSRWVSERPIPIAGFNLGKYQHVQARAQDVPVDVYATKAVERGFPQAEARNMIPDTPTVPGVLPAPPITIPSALPSPARNAQTVAAKSANAIDVFSRWFGPFPYSGLSLTQMPGDLSQGWPGLIFLSSLSFLTPEEKSDLHISRVDKTLMGSVVAHETAHQWWGDLVLWNDYRDQWISEGLADYSSFMLFESEDPQQFRAVMEKYRDDLLQKNKAGVALMNDGPVTLGARLSCSQFPQGYQAISYGRGTWLFHMLRYMLRDAEPAGDKQNAEEPFVRALRRMRERFEGKAITTRELLQVFEEELPRSLWYEGRKSLDWFYQGWVSGTAVPRFELRSLKYADKPGATVVSGVILQKEAPEDLVTPVPIYASRAGRTVLLGRVFADGPETSFHLSAPEGTRKILIDPRQTLLARTH